MFQLNMIFFLTFVLRLSDSGHRGFGGREMRETDFDYLPDPMGRLGYGVWRQRTRRDPFGRLPEDDEPFADLRRRWSAGERFADDDSMFALGDSVGENGANDRLDVAKVQVVLHNEGRFDLDRSDGPTGYFSSPLAEAIRQRQADHGLADDGVLLPGGETIVSLKSPTPARERDSLGAALPARPGERPKADSGRPPAGVKVAGLPVVLVPAAVAVGRWMLQEGAKRTAARLAAELATKQASSAANAIRSAPAVAAATPNSMETPSAAASATEPPKPEIVSEGAVRAWLDAGRAGLTLPMAGSRGADYPTQKALNITAKACREVLNEMWPEYAEIVQHRYGATRDGKGEGNQLSSSSRTRIKMDCEAPIAPTRAGGGPTWIPRTRTLTST
jgi:peptidoglycan hydrolase-like protein with peptidoglycan-binding domain